MNDHPRTVIFGDIPIGGVFRLTPEGPDRIKSDARHYYRAGNPDTARYPLFLAGHHPVFVRDESDLNPR